MKTKLVWLMVLSILTSIGLILVIVASVNAANTIAHVNYFSYTSSSLWDFGYGIFGAVLLFIAGIAQFVLGIIVLASLQKVTEGKGMVIASGILAILWGVFFVGAIVSGIASTQVKESKLASANISSPVAQDSELEQMKKELAELKKANSNNDTATK